ncbi:MAG: hypothetical protein M1281_02660 [Chloroflexi bacterium]|nr:hypothetical protein [Chloroflexota bacterium]
MNATNRTRNILLVTLFLCGALFQGTSHPVEARNVGEIACYAVSLATPDADLSGYPGETVVYTLVLENPAPVTDSFTFQVQNAGTWVVSSLANVKNLSAYAKKTILFEVTIPADAAGGETRAITVTAASLHDPTQKASVILTTTVIPIYSAVLDPLSDAQTGFPQQTLLYELQLTNTGKSTTLFELSLTGNGWGALNSSSLSLNPGQSGTIQVSVTIPPAAPDGSQEVTGVLVKMPDGSEAAGTLTTTVKWHHYYLALVYTVAN